MSQRRFPLRAAPWMALAGLLALAAGPMAARAGDEYGPTPLEKVAKQGVPKIEFDKEKFDFGELIQGDPAVHTFHVKNVGDSVLKITDVRPG